MEPSLLTPHSHPSFPPLGPLPPRVNLSPVPVGQQAGGLIGGPPHPSSAVTAEGPASALDVLLVVAPWPHAPPHLPSPPHPLPHPRWVRAVSQRCPPWAASPNSGCPSWSAVRSCCGPSPTTPGLTRCTSTWARRCGWGCGVCWVLGVGRRTGVVWGEVGGAGGDIACQGGSDVWRRPHWRPQMGVTAGVWLPGGRRRRGPLICAASVYAVRRCLVGAC